MTTFRQSLIALATACAFFLPGAADAQCTAGQPGKAIAESFNARWTSAVQRGDGNAVRALYDGEALLMPPTDEVLFGAPAIAAYLLGETAIGTLADYGIDLVSCERRGNALHVAGVWGATRTDGSGNIALLGGNFVRVLTRRADGAWVSSHDIWN